MFTTRTGKIARPPRNVYERLSQRLAESARHFDNTERIRRMRELFFADVDELQKSGRVILPKA